MTDLRDLSDDDLLDRLATAVGYGPDEWFRNLAAELRRRMAELRAERDEAQIGREEAKQAQRRLLNRINRFVLGANAAQADRDRLREAMEVALANLDTPDPLFGMALNAAGVLRAALKEEK